MKDIKLSNALSQVSAILAYTEELKEQLPTKLIDFIESNKSINYNWEFDPCIPLEEQNLLQDTKVLLGIIYRAYMCDDDERKELDKALFENEKKRNLNN